MSVFHLFSLWFLSSFFHSVCLFVVSVLTFLIFYVVFMLAHPLFIALVLSFFLSFLVVLLICSLFCLQQSLNASPEGSSVERVCVPSLPSSVMERTTAETTLMKPTVVIID